MANWFPLYNLDHYSILLSSSKPDQIASRIAECGYAGAAITNAGSISGAYGFQAACKKEKKKSILGCEFTLTDNKGTVVVLAKNLKGWKSLVQAVSASNEPDNFKGGPRISFDRLVSFYDGNWCVFAGHLGTELGNCVFTDPKLAYFTNSYENARTLVDSKWRENITQGIKRYLEKFGKENFFLSIQLMDQDNLPATLIVSKILRSLSENLGVRRIAVAGSYYPKREDAADHRVLLACGLKVRLTDLEGKIKNSDEFELQKFLKSNNYHIPSLEEINKLHTADELENTIVIADACEEYTIGNKPLLPEFPCPDNLKPNEYLWRLCEEGWQAKIAKKIPVDKHEAYRIRLKEEFDILANAGLSSYFLMVQDYINYARNTLKCRVGKGRGSAAGCLVSYLSGITDIDPIRFDLLFERFYNAGRNTKDSIALPDIDSDFPVDERDKVIDYIFNKWGFDKVGNIVTFGRSQGRGAIKGVLRAHNSVSFEEMNRITQFIPDESKISDDLQEMLEEFGTSSIVRWALENNAEGLKEWCWIKETSEDGKDITLDGELAIEFAQAIRLEGTYVSKGKHASGIIICSERIADIVPLVYDEKSKSRIVDVDMRDCEKYGLIKADILGLATLSKIQSAEKLIRTGTLR